MACIPHKALAVMQKMGLSTGSVVNMARMTNTFPYKKQNILPQTKSNSMQMQDADEILSNLLETLSLNNDRMGEQNQVLARFEVNGKDVNVLFRPSKIKHHIDVFSTGEFDKISLNTDDETLWENGSLYLMNVNDADIRADQAYLVSSILKRITNRRFSESNNDAENSIKIKGIQYGEKEFDVDNKSSIDIALDMASFRSNKRDIFNYSRQGAISPPVMTRTAVYLSDRNSHTLKTVFVDANGRIFKNEHPKDETSIDDLNSYLRNSIKDSKTEPEWHLY